MPALTAFADGNRGEICLDSIAERDDTPDHEHDVHEVQIADGETRNSRGRVAVDRRDGRGDHAQRADDRAGQQSLVISPAAAPITAMIRTTRGSTRSRTETAAAEQQLRRSIVERVPRSQSSDHQHRAPYEHVTTMPSRPPHGPAGERTHELAPGRIAAGDHRRLEHETGNRYCGRIVMVASVADTNRIAGARGVPAAHHWRDAIEICETGTATDGTRGMGWHGYCLAIWGFHWEDV